MITNPVGNTALGTALAAPGKSATALGDLGSSQFMQLLLAQLRNQNPLDPVKDQEFMSQITQMNSLEQLQKMNSALQAMSKSNRLSEAAGFIGKTVTARGADGQARTGVVTGVTLQNDQALLLLGHDQIALSDIISVAGPSDGERQA